MSLLPLLAGLAIFFAAHLLTTRRAQRAAMIAQYGAGTYRGLYSLVSAIGLVLIVWGFGYYRAQGYIPLWEPPRFFSHITLLLMWPAMILLAAAYSPPGHIRAKAKHPMLAAIKLWAFGHLLANGDLGSLLLFGSFLAYGVYDRIAMKKREAAEGARTLAPNATGDIIAVMAGTLVWLAIMFWLHPLLFGVAVLPGR